MVLVCYLHSSTLLKAQWNPTLDNFRVMISNKMEGDIMSVADKLTCSIKNCCMTLCREAMKNQIQEYFTWWLLRLILSVSYDLFWVHDSNNIYCVAQLCCPTAVNPWWIPLVEWWQLFMLVDHLCWWPFLVLVAAWIVLLESDWPCSVRWPRSLVIGWECENTWLCSV